jgi:uncharacterized protein (TIGR02145 family)
MKQIWIMITVVLFTVIKLSAQCPSGNNTFTGATNSDWNTASNWSQGCVPVSPITGVLSIEANCVLSGNTSYTFNPGSTLKIKTGFKLTYNTPTSTGVGSITYGGQTYATKLMPDGKWWMAENLNIGTMISTNTSMSNDNVIQKYCYQNDTAKCNTYGGLYEWNEVMQYVNTSGGQGICPVGWHIPTDAEWTALENSLPRSDKASRLSSNAALWFDGSLEASIHFGTSGFNALPGGFRSSSSSFGLRDNANFWSSTESSSTNVINRHIDFEVSVATFDLNPSKLDGNSVRCRQN